MNANRAMVKLPIGMKILMEGSSKMDVRLEMLIDMAKPLKSCTVKPAKLPPLCITPQVQDTKVKSTSKDCPQETALFMAPQAPPGSVCLLLDGPMGMAMQFALQRDVI